MGVKLEKIGIIGAGISGLIAAVALTQRGYNVSVFEKSGDPREVNVAISLWPNATRILKSLGLLDKIIAQGAIISNFTIKHAKGEVMNSSGLELYDSPAVGIERSELHSILANALPQGVVRINKRFSAYQNSNNGVVAFFEDGGSETFDFLIGADGLYSKVRDQMHNDGKPMYRNYTIWHGTVDYTHQNIETNASIEIMGNGKRFGMIPLGKGKIGWWASYNEVLKSYQHMEGRKKKLVNMFRGFYSPISQMISATNEEDIIKSPIYDRDPVSRWHDGKVLLLGNAAHPMTPNRGQASSLSVEDAYVLSKLLSSSDNLESVLTEFEKLRVPRAHLLHKESLYHGHIGQLEKKWKIMFRNYMIKKMPIKKSRKILDDMFMFRAD